METKVLLDPKEYPALLEEIRENGFAYRPDCSGKECKLVFDQDGIPHREDFPEVYPKWRILSLEDLVMVFDLMST